MDLTKSSILNEAYHYQSDYNVVVDTRIKRIIHRFSSLFYKHERKDRETKTVLCKQRGI